MPAVIIDPSVEACQVLVDRINSVPTGSYSLAVDATYSEQLIEPLEEIDGLRVDVVTEGSETLDETLSVEDRTSHFIRIWIRDKIGEQTNAVIDPLKLLVRQIFQRVNNFNSADGRVKVWECDNDEKESPDKATLQRLGLFVTSILLRVEVEPPV